MFLSHQYPSDGWAVVQFSVVETMGQVGAGAELLSHPTPVLRHPLAVVQQQQ